MLQPVTTTVSPLGMIFPLVIVGGKEEEALSEKEEASEAF